MLPRAPLILMLLLAAGLSAGPQVPARPGGTIRRRVPIPNIPQARTRPNVAEPSSVSVPAVNRRRVVVYLESAPRQAFGELSPARARMDQRAEQFSPRVLAITAGTTVEFPN